MNRIGTSMKSSSHQRYLRELEVRKAQLQNKISGEEKHLTLDEDPAASGLASKYRSDLSRLEGYQTNISRLQSENQQVHSELESLSRVMIRAKELVVQAANGTYHPEDLKAGAVELNELIGLMIDLGNATDENGNALFAGTLRTNRAFEAFKGRIPGAQEPMLTHVLYVGNPLSNTVAIDQGKGVEVERSGGKLFWGSPETLYGANNAGGYRVAADSSIFINGREIPLRAGDSLHAIAARINQAPVAVRADVDPENHLILAGNRAEQLVLADAEGSSVLRDLGILQEGLDPPYNLSPYALKEGDNIFNQLIDVRNMMLAGDTDALGSRGLREVDRAHAAVVNNLARIGAQTARLDAMESALGVRELNLAKANQDESVVTDIDRTELMLDYKRLDHVHTATLQSAAKALQPSLLNFLR